MALCQGKILDFNLYSAFVRLILLWRQGADENGYRHVEIVQYNGVKIIFISFVHNQKLIYFFK